MALHVDWLGEEQMIEKNRCAEQHEELREGVSALLHSIVAIALQYSYSTR